MLLRIKATGKTGHLTNRGLAGFVPVLPVRVASFSMKHYLLAVWSSSATQMLMGALLSALIAGILDWAKRPKLDIRIYTLPHNVKQYGIKREILAEYTVVLVEVRNTKRWPKFWPRQTAVGATARISFHDTSSCENLFENRAMRGRWASQPQPETVVVTGEEIRLSNDPSLISIHPSIDIAWGESEQLDIACRFIGDDCAYGFSNENYYDEDRVYRAKRWKITAPVCLVRVEVRSVGERATEVFRLRHITGSDTLKLTSATRQQRKRLRSAIEGTDLDMRLVDYIETSNQM